MGVGKAGGKNVAEVEGSERKKNGAGNLVNGPGVDGADVVRLRTERHVKGHVHEDWSTCKVFVAGGMPPERVEVPRVGS